MVEHPTRACHRFLERFSDFVDGRLPSESRAVLQAHLDCCEGCLRHLAAYRNGVDALRSSSRIEMDPAEFWEQLQHRIWLEGIEPPRRRISTRGLAALATVVMALAIVWVGTRIDLGFRQVAESARQPVVVVAGPPTPAVTHATVQPARSVLASREASRPSARPPRPVPTALVTRRTVETPDLDAAAQAMIERDVAAIRERLDADAWVVATTLEAEPTIVPSEPIPVH